MSTMLESRTASDTSQSRMPNAPTAARPISTRDLSRPEPRGQVVDQRFFFVGADGRAPAHHLLDRTRPAGARQFLLFDDVGFVTGMACPLVRRSSRIGGCMRRCRLWS